MGFWTVAMPLAACRVGEMFVAAVGLVSALWGSGMMSWLVEPRLRVRSAASRRDRCPNRPTAGKKARIKKDTWAIGGSAAATPLWVAVVRLV